MTLKKTAVLFALPLLALALFAACASTGSGEEITEERAIELARPHVTFEPTRVEAVKEQSAEGRPVWRVSFYGKAASAAGPGEFAFVLLDRKTGEMVSLGMS